MFNLKVTVPGKSLSLGNYPSLKKTQVRSQFLVIKMLPHKYRKGISSNSYLRVYKTLCASR